MQGNLRANKATAGEIRRRLVGIAISAAMAFLGASAANAQSGAAGNPTDAGLVTIRIAGADAVNPSTPLFVAAIAWAAALAPAMVV